MLWRAAANRLTLVQLADLEIYDGNEKSRVNARYVFINIALGPLSLKRLVYLQQDAGMALLQFAFCWSADAGHFRTNRELYSSTLIYQIFKLSNFHIRAQLSVGPTTEAP